MEWSFLSPKTLPTVDAVSRGAANTGKVEWAFKGMRHLAGDETGAALARPIGQFGSPRRGGKGPPRRRKPIRHASGSSRQGSKHSISPI